MKAHMIIGFLLISAVCVSCRLHDLTKEKLITCVTQSGAISMASGFSIHKLKNEGPQVGFNVVGCLMRESGYIDAHNKLDEAKVVRDFIDILDAELFNVAKIKEYEVACIREANKETTEGNVMKSYLSCALKNMLKFAERMKIKIKEH